MYHAFFRFFSQKVVLRGHKRQHRFYPPIVHFPHDFSIKFLWKFIRFLWKLLMNDQILKSLWFFYKTHKIFMKFHKIFMKSSIFIKKWTYFFCEKNPLHIFFWNFHPKITTFNRSHSTNKPQNRLKVANIVKPM